MLKKILTFSLAAFMMLQAIVPATTVKAANDTLLNTYGKTLSNSGAAVNLYQLRNSSTLSVIKQQYNSITMENEMKPDAMLGHSPSLQSVSDAKSNGYYIPSNYTESTVPRINFTNLDEIMKICYNNGLKLRAHTLLWHAQTPDYFFKVGYSNNGAYVSQSVMNARMEMYIKTYMNHVYLSQYGSVVYAWDVVNEYLHADENKSGWAKVYGRNLGTQPEFVKRAFQYSYDCISYFGLTNSVKLFYNDYNTYMEADKVVSLINYINSGRKICAGIGMQSHLGTDFPSVSYYKSALQKFVNAGFEVQITELDVGNKSSSAQARYVYDLMKSILAVKKSGGNITGITWWGLYDSVSWRKDNPLLFSGLYNPKESYYSALQAYKDAGF
jgi:endo-1,4-beta-xylanase